MTISRGTTEGFIQRTRTNLRLIENGYETDAEGHVVTQLVNSLLGIVIFPWEHEGLADLKKKKTSEISLDGWPDAIMEKGVEKAQTLGEFTNHLRNAVAHGYVSFSSDSRELADVTLTFEDRQSKAKAAFWRARIDGQQLRQLCEWLMDQIEESVN